MLLNLLVLAVLVGAAVLASVWVVRPGSLAAAVGAGALFVVAAGLFPDESPSGLVVPLALFLAATVVSAGLPYPQPPSGVAGNAPVRIPARHRRMRTSPSTGAQQSLRADR